MMERFSDDSLHSSLELKTLQFTFEHETILLIVSRLSCFTDLIGLRYKTDKDTHMGLCILYCILLKIYLLNLPQQADNEYI